MTEGPFIGRLLMV